MLFSLITSRSNQGLYTILHDFLQIVVDNVDIVVSGCPISFPCQLLRYSDLLCQFDLYRHLSHQQSGVEPQLHQPDTYFYSSQWFSGLLVLAISRAENHLLWPIVALVDQEPACRYLENGRLLSNKILHFSILYSKNDHSSGFSELLCFFKILRFLHICLYFFIIHLSFSQNPELYPELHHHQSCLKMVIYTSYFLVSLLDHHRNLSFLRSSSSKVRICRQMGWKYWKYTCCNCWVPCQKISHSQGNIYTVLLYHAHYRFHQEHLLHLMQKNNFLTTMLKNNTYSISSWPFPTVLRSWSLTLSSSRHCRCLPMAATSSRSGRTATSTARHTY